MNFFDSRVRTLNSCPNTKLLIYRKFQINSNIQKIQKTVAYTFKK